MALLTHIGMESLDFQPTTFFKELTAAFAELQEAKKDAGDSPVVQQISKIIANHTGINAIISIGLYDPCVEIPHLDKNHPLVTAIMRNHVSSSDGLQLIAKAEGAVRGSVNLKTGKVSGVFSELQARIHLPRTMFENKRFDADEIAAITMHEVGHLFTYFEYISRTVTTNQVLAGVSKGLDGSGTVEERQAVLTSAKEVLKLKDLDVKELAKSNNKKVAEVVIITNVARQTESELGSNLYDNNSWEMLADQFAARYGAYRALTTALAKYYKGAWNISFRSLPSFLFMEAFKLAMLFMLPGLGILFMAMDGSGDGTYDRPGARLTRVRNQIVENLKDKNLSKDDHSRLMADLSAIDDVLAGVNDRRQLVGLIWDSLIPAARRAYRQEKQQQELEALVANDLFIKAAELKQMA